jgi:hypothetical protein
MKIESIDIRNTMGVREVKISLETPIAIFAGGNHSGKSSLLEAVRLALGDDPVRVSLKKQYDSLVTEGAKNGRVSVMVDGVDHGITLPAGKWYGAESHSKFLPFVLDARRFAALKPDERRTVLFDLTACKITPAAVRDLLVRREIAVSRIEKVLPMLGRGFPAAEEWAKDQAKTAKSDWKAITSETWGAQKAEGWEAPVPEAYEPVRMKHVSALLDECRDNITACNRDLGALQERKNVHTEWHTRQQNVGKQATRLAELKTKLAFDEKELAGWESKVATLQQRAGTGPRVGLVHDLARAVDWFIGVYGGAVPDEHSHALTIYETQHGSIDGEGDPEATAALPAAIRSRDLMLRSVENDRRDVTQAGATEAGPEPERADEAELGRLAAQSAELTAQQQELDDERRRLDRLAMAHQIAKDDTVKATKHHADVLDWLRLAEALAPDGIPGELLGTALKPINDRLRYSSEETGWMQVAIGADMLITGNGRPYTLLSESEQWRVDAMLAEAISNLSGIGLLLLDRADLLEPKARPELLSWLDALAMTGAIDTALVAITLKSAPTGFPETMSAYWIADGRIETVEAMAEVA